MSPWVPAGLLLAGALFMLLAAAGIVRLPDFFMRVQAMTKASTMGIGLTFVGVATYFGDVGTVVRALLVVAFIYLTAPVSAHVIARAAHRQGVPLWGGTVVDELARDRRRRQSPPGPGRRDEAA